MMDNDTTRGISSEILKIFKDGNLLEWDTMPPDPLPTGVYGYTVEMTKPGDTVRSFDSIRAFGVVNVEKNGIIDFGIYRNFQHVTTPDGQGVIMRVYDRVSERLEEHLIQNFLHHMDNGGSAGDPDGDPAPDDDCAPSPNWVITDDAHEGDTLVISWVDGETDTVYLTPMPSPPPEIRITFPPNAWD